MADLELSIDILQGPDFYARLWKSKKPFNRKPWHFTVYGYNHEKVAASQGYKRPEDAESVARRLVRPKIFSVQASLEGAPQESLKEALRPPKNTA